MKKGIIIFLLLVSSALHAETKVLAFAGSTRIDSYNKMLVKEAAAIAQDKGAKVTYIDLKDFHMPYYDHDDEQKDGMPASARKFKKLLMDSDAVIIATPEYNGSIPAVLKNALDWASRTEDGKPSQDAFKGKKFALMSTSPGKGGGIRGLAHLQSIIEALGGIVVEKHVAVADAASSFDKNGTLTNVDAKNDLSEEIGLLLE